MKEIWVMALPTTWKSHSTIASSWTSHPPKRAMVDTRLGMVPYQSATSSPPSPSSHPRPTRASYLRRQLFSSIAAAAFDDAWASLTSLTQIYQKPYLRLRALALASRTICATTQSAEAFLGFLANAWAQVRCVKATLSVGSGWWIDGGGLDMVLWQVWAWNTGIVDDDNGGDGRIW